MSDSVGDLIKDAVNALGSIFTKSNKDVLTTLRQPTPIKITRVVTSDAGGFIGDGFSTLRNPRPVPLWECPMAHEAWINRIVIEALTYMPANPLTTGNLKLLSSTGNTIQFLPVGGVIAPIVITEGRLSAPHLNNGEWLTVLGEGIPVSVSLKFDMQIVLVSGVSSDTPRQPIWSNVPGANMEILD